MQKITFFLILIIIFSCTNKKIEPVTNPDDKTENIGGFNNEQIQKIAHLYKPEKMTSTYSEKSNFEIDLYNSDTLKKDKDNLKSHSDKIAVLLKAYLIKNNIYYNDVIIKIHQKNDETQFFQYSHQDLVNIKSIQH